MAVLRTTDPPKSSTVHALAAESGSCQSSTRRLEDTSPKSLRECTTGRGPLNSQWPSPLGRDYHDPPRLTSRVQWKPNRVDTASNAPVIGVSKGQKDVEIGFYSPAPSSYVTDIDMEDDSVTARWLSSSHLNSTESRPSTGTSTGIPPTLTSRTSTPDSFRAFSSTSSETERRQPNFPGNRDIIGGSDNDSNSPHTNYEELQERHPVSRDSGRTLHTSSPRSHREETFRPTTHLSPVSNGHERIVHWQASTSPYTQKELSPYARTGVSEHGERRLFHGQSNSYHYRSTSDSATNSSPALSLSSIPSSPRITLPPIVPRHEHEHLISARPHASSYAGPSSGTLQWRVNAHLPSLGLRRTGNFTPEYPDDRDLGRTVPDFPTALTTCGGVCCTHKSHNGHIEEPYLHTSAPPPPTSHHYQPVAHTGPPPRDKNAWKRYAQLLPGVGQQEFRCMWQSREGEEHHMLNSSQHDSNLVCGYTGKRHLVKRHIETVHLQFKDHVCSHCGKAFPQRVSLNIHINRHTGEKPHKCNYNCGKSFGDPARRHKHMVDVHGYTPQGPRKRHRNADSYYTSAANSSFETMAPWTASLTKPAVSSSAVAQDGERSDSGSSDA